MENKTLIMEALRYLQELPREELLAALERHKDTKIAQALIRGGYGNDNYHQDSYECRYCQKISYNDNDIKERYCGNCNRFDWG